MNKNTVVSVLSDLHLEFGPLGKPLPGGDVCLLAGDIVTARDLNPRREVNLIDKWQAFQDAELSKYKYVYAVPGNHEYYGVAYQHALDVLRESSPRVRWLQNEVVVHDNFVLFGSTFWTDLNRGDPLTVYDAEQNMSDYYTIKYVDQSDTWRRFRARDAMIANGVARHALATCLAEHTTIPVVVMTHHGPTALSARQGGRLEYAYHNTGLEDLILANPQLMVWVHGHTHDSKDYMVGDTCRVLCNPRGYYAYEVNPDFNPAFQFDMEIVE